MKYLYYTAFIGVLFCGSCRARPHASSMSIRDLPARIGFPYPWACFDIRYLVNTDTPVDTSDVYISLTIAGISDRHLRAICHFSKPPTLGGHGDVHPTEKLVVEYKLIDYHAPEMSQGEICKSYFVYL